MSDEEALELRRVLWLVRDAILSANHVTSTEKGLARIVYLNDSMCPEFVRLLANGIEVLSRHAEGQEKP